MVLGVGRVSLWSGRFHCVPTQSPTYKQERIKHILFAKPYTQRSFVVVVVVVVAGINELEGAVLMDSDEYLKISHEVKALKTAILKLKRELQSGEQPVRINTHCVHTYVYTHTQLSA